MGEKPKELDELVDLPNSMFHVWNYFIDLNNVRSSNGFGVNPISFTEMKSYFDLYEIVPFQYEIEAIKRLDQIAREEFAKAQEKQEKKNKKN